jgi:drug/metabolite transporter (DMT)-like permease
MTRTPEPAKSEPPRRSQARAVSLFGILAVSTASIFIRFAQAAGGPSLLIAAGRMLIAAAVLLALVAALDRADVLRVTRRDLLLAILSGLFLAFHFAAWITSLELTSVASSVVLVTTTPLWVSLASTILLREPPRRSVVAGMLVALVGTGVVALSESCTWVGGLACSFRSSSFRPTALQGDALALFGAWMVSGYFLIGRTLRPRMPLRVYALLTYGTAGLILLGALAVARIPLAPYAGEVYVWIVALGLIPQLLGHSAFNWALRYLSATFVTVTVLGEPVGTILLAWLLLNEVPTLMQIAGAVLILGGVFAAARPEHGVAGPASAADRGANLTTP